MKRDVNALFNQEQTLLRKIASDNKDYNPGRLMYRASVAYVDRIGTEFRPRFSIKAKVVGVDVPGVDTEYKFYPPLFPIHLISIPEVGEEVTLICEELGRLDTAYWISRTNPKNFLTKVNIGEDIETNDNTQDRTGKYGRIKLPIENIDVFPNEKYEIPTPRVKPGDVIIQGRSNTFVRNTFDTKNKKGVLEMITAEQKVSDENFYKDDFRKSDGVRLLETTLCDIDTQILKNLYDLKFHSDFTHKSINRSVVPQKNYESSYLLLEAIEHRLISRKSVNEIQHIVLGETQEIWIRQLLDLIRDLIDDIQIYRENVVTLTNNVATHVHMSTGPTSPPLTPELIQFSTQLPQKLNTDKQNFDKDKTDFGTIKDGGNTQIGENKGIRFHHSDHIAAN